MFKQEKLIGELTTEVETCKLIRQQNEHLKEQLQDCEEELAQLRKIEIVAERYRKKLETQQDVQTRLRILQDENSVLHASLEEYLASDNSRGYKEESERSELLQRVNQLETMLVEKTAEISGLEAEVTKQRLQMDELARVANREESAVTDLTEEEELRQRIEELELEVEALRKGSFRGGSKRKAADIRALIDHYEVLLRVNRKQATVSGVGPEGAKDATLAEPVGVTMTKTDWQNEAVRAQREAEDLKQELTLMSRAWHSLAARVQQQNIMVMKRRVETSAGWLTRQRRALERAEFGP